MGPFSKPAVPPAMAEYVSTLQPAGAAASAAPQQTAYRLFRASDGKTRLDTGNTSLINDPTAGKTILLDHLKKTAQITPSVPPAPSMPGMPQMPQMPQIPGMPAVPQPTVHVQDLGKSFMQGMEVEGKRYTIQPPPMPQMPGMPQAPKPPVPGMPQIPGVAAPQIPGMPPVPGMPKIPGMPQLPPKPQVPTVAEVWTSPKLQLPMASKVNGGFGQQTAICQNAVPGEPNPAVFQVPPDYKQILPPPPKLPTMPKPPIPNVTPPKLPGMG